PTSTHTLSVYPFSRLRSDPAPLPIYTLSLHDALPIFGYGDVVPVTPLGRIVTVVAIVVGFAMIALPVAIISSAFAEEVRRRDFEIGRAPSELQSRFDLVCRLLLEKKNSPHMMAEVLLR